MYMIEGQSHHDDEPDIGTRDVGNMNSLEIEAELVRLKVELPPNWSGLDEDRKRVFLAEKRIEASGG